MTPNQQMIDKLKSTGNLFSAGALTAELGMSRDYGCHFGMRSELASAKELFYAGFDARFNHKVVHQASYDNDWFGLGGN